MVTNEIDPVLIKCLDGTASENEFVLAWEWIRQSRQNKEYYEQFRDIWISSSVFGASGGADMERSWLRFIKDNSELLVRKELPERQSGKSRLIKIFSIAASLLIAFLIGGVISRALWHQSAVNDEGSFVVEAPRGAKSFASLSDGTKIWLNAGSKIIYRRNYNLKNRDVFLEGEAYFVVAKNNSIPFYVHSSGLAIRALGTSFNVKAYPDENLIETTLVEGKISIESIGKTGKKEKIFIEPNQKASFFKETSQFSVEPNTKRNESAPVHINAKIARIEVAKKVDTEIYTSWKDKRWVFKKQKLSDFAVLLERLYDVKILFKDEELRQYSLSGSFAEENLEQVLKAIQLTIPLEYSIQHQEVIFRINKEMRSNYKKLLKPSVLN